MSSNLNKYAVVILSSGDSARMGTPKALLNFNAKLTFIDKIITTYINTGITSICLVVNNQLFNTFSKKPFKYQENITTLVNDFPKKGRLYTLQQGIKQHNNKNIFVQNIDNPFVSEELIVEMVEKLKENSYVNPCYQEKGGHPILLSKQVAKQLLGKENVTLKEALIGFNRIKLNVNDRKILANINSPEDYRLYFTSN